MIPSSAHEVRALGFPFSVFFESRDPGQADLAFASGTRRASRVLPIFLRACGSLLSFSSCRFWRLFLFLSFCASSFFLRSACRGVVLAGCAHDRTVSAAGRASAFFSSSRRFFCAFFSARSQTDPDKTGRVTRYVRSKLDRMACANSL